VTSGVIGRDEELAAVRAFVTSVSDGPAGLVIEGEAGIGKTTLWRAGVDAARERSYRVLTATPTAAETALSTSCKTFGTGTGDVARGGTPPGAGPWNG
jgi:Cdc6-like AAA superfamily ATPase